MLNRRKFINTSSISLGMGMVGLPKFDFSSFNSTLRVGLIGCGWYGKSDLFRLIQVAPIDVVCICDVDQNHLDEAAVLISQRQLSHKRPKKYIDYRNMLEKHELDLVIIGTPDHWHALQAIDAMDAGAHLYLQKPISIDVLEGEAILAKARDKNRIVQIGTQRRSTPHLIEAKKKIIEGDLLGKISHVEMCCYYHMRANRSPKIGSIPAFFDYEMYVGPAPMRPFDGIPHRGWWRALTEYSNGIMGDMCVHMFDTVRWMLDLGWPDRISSTGGIYVQKESKANTPDTQTAIFEYPELNCIWNHRSWGTAPDPEYPWAFMIYGEKGTLKGSVHKYDFIPNGEGEQISKEVTFEREKFPEDINEKDIELHVAPATRYHMLDLLHSIENKKLPVADIEQGHISTASCIIANMSMNLGRPLAYDPKQKNIKGDLVATEMLKRAYRKPWQHPWEI